VPSDRDAVRPRPIRDNLIKNPGVLRHRAIDIGHLGALARALKMQTVHVRERGLAAIGRSDAKLGGLVESNLGRADLGRRFGSRGNGTSP
jgi:hypothetical protein